MNEKCKYCDFIGTNTYQVVKHRWEAHPETCHKSHKTTLIGDAMTALNAGRQQIITAIKQMEFERESLHKKVLEYDDTIAKYRKLL